MTATSTAIASSPIPFVRLVTVETRKFFDTLVGQVLIVVTVVLSLGIMVGRAWFGVPELQSVITISGAVLSLLLPAMGILVVTSEWSQNTASRTFALEPRRVRVVAAQLFPPMIATTVACAVVAGAAYLVLVAVAAVRGVPADFTIDPAATAGWFVANLVFVLHGVALGTLLLNAPAAIVFVTVSTPLWGLVSIISDTGAAVASWLDLGRTTAPLLDGVVTGDDVARIAVSVAVSVLLPLVVGAVRVVRREVR